MNKALNRLCSVQVDHDDVRANREVKIELETAVSDLLADSYFELVGGETGPYRLVISTRASRLAFHVADVDGIPLVSHLMSLSPLREVIRTYVSICEAHYEAAGKGNTRRLEAIDMGRRAAHNEASELLRERLAAKVRTDLNTARRLFTIIAACRVGNALALGFIPAEN